MVEAKRQGMEKPMQIEQRKVWGWEWGPQVEQTALLAIYIGQPQGEEKRCIKRGAKWPGVSLSLFSLSLLVSMPSHLKDVFSFIF